MFAGEGDALTVEPADRLSLEVGGPFAADAPAGPDNLVIRVADELRKVCGVSRGARIRLEKHLPAGAGLGGGSSDAATALKALNALWQTGLAPAELAPIGSRFGADIPMCLEASALRAGKTGTVIEPWHHAPDVPLVLVWPASAVATAAVFAGLHKVDNQPLPDVRLNELADIDRLAAYLRRTRNDMTEAAATLEPRISEALQTIADQPGCLIARMSGSGSACYGLFSTPEEADLAAERIIRAKPRWWVRSVLAG